MNALNIPALRFDRRVDPAFLALLMPGGFASSLVEFSGHAGFATDLQFRADPKTSEQRASMYVGLTKVLDLKWHKTRGVKLSAHTTWTAHETWKPRWTTWQKDFASRHWRDVELYVEAVVERVDPKFRREGAVQAAISAYRSSDYAAIDREAVVGFATQAAKSAFTKSVAAPIIRAISGTRGPVWWNNQPRSLGDECDALLLRDGELIALEVKPAKASGTIPWAPLQARHYANLFQAWVDSCPDAKVTIEGMAGQRKAVGLVAGAAQSEFDPDKPVRPAIAIQRGTSKVVLDRLRRVNGALQDADLDSPPLHLFEVSSFGRLDPVEW